MDETKIEKLARLSGRVASKIAGAVERRGYDIRGKMSAPIRRVPVALLLQSVNRMDELQSDWLGRLMQPRALAAWRAREISQHRTPIQKSQTVENQQRELEADYKRLVRAFPVAGENDGPKTPCRP